MAKTLRNKDTSPGRDNREGRVKSTRRGLGDREGYGRVIPLKRDKFVPRNHNQKRLASLILANDGTFATGPAGTGKTHVALAIGAEFLLADNSRRIICTNPAVEIGEKLGILPGNKDEKIAIAMRPMRDILNKLLGASHVDNLVRDERICFEPLGSILGLTFDDSLVLLDEAQNSTPAQMKALLTRIGERSKIVLAGDFMEQKFIEDPVTGLEDALKRLGGLPNVGHVDFTEDDITRSGFCKDVIVAYRRKYHLEEVA